MTDYSTVTIISTAETALKRLKNAKIGVYNCKKDGINFIFNVKDKDVKKVFAIFSKPCYNISVRRSRKKTALSFALCRIGLIIGFFIFVISAYISNLLIFRVEVTGSGKYLYGDIKSIIYDLGYKKCMPYKSLDVRAAESAVLSLPNVTFCKIKKRGSALVIDVEIDEAPHTKFSQSNLTSDCFGILKKLVVICGTAQKSVGDSVSVGDELIGAYMQAGEESISCLCVGFAEIECSSSYEYHCPEESEVYQKAAYSKANLYADSIVNRTHTISREGDEVIYLIEFTYLHKISINME